MADSIALIGVVISFSQLILGLGALAPRKPVAEDGDKSAEASPPGAVGRTLDALAGDRRALDALLIAAVCVLFASFALFLVEDTVDALMGPGDLGDVRLQTRVAFNTAILIGGALSLAGIGFARLAWSRWLHGGDQMLGVVLAVTLTVLSGVVGVYLATPLGLVLATKVRQTTTCHEAIEAGSRRLWPARPRGEERRGSSSAWSLRRALRSSPPRPARRRTAQTA